MSANAILKRTDAMPASIDADLKAVSDARLAEAVECCIGRMTATGQILRGSHGCFSSVGWLCDMEHPDSSYRSEFMPFIAATDGGDNRDLHRQRLPAGGDFSTHGLTHLGATILESSMTTLETMLARTLTNRPPADTFRFIAMCATDAADLYDEIVDLEPESEEAIAYRLAIIDACAAMFTAIVHANPDARWRLGRGLSEGQRMDRGVKRETRLNK